jgi:uncharacterized protein YecE (DUF72 family)
MSTDQEGPKSPIRSTGPQGLNVGRLRRFVSVLVGAGGWGYFAGGLAAYARAFSFVEGNASFYRRVPESSARGWRRQVPPDFVFSLKAHWSASHGSHLHATPAARDAFAHDLRIARILGAAFVILQTPPSVAIGTREAAGLRDLIGLAGPAGPRIGLEARAHAGGPLPPPLRGAMEDLQVLDVVDLSRERPRVVDDTVYSRLFGKGERNAYEFDDAELRELDRAGSDAVTIAYAFHGVRMYRDAARFLSFKRTGVFPAVTDSIGVGSLAAVLREDARFPASRSDLLRDQGWKVVDLDRATRVHAREMLTQLPDRTFESLDDVTSAIEAIGPPRAVGTERVR